MKIGKLGLSVKSVETGRGFIAMLFYRKLSLAFVCSVTKNGLWFTTRLKRRTHHIVGINYSLHKQYGLISFIFLIFNVKFLWGWGD